MTPKHHEHIALALVQMLAEYPEGHEAEMLARIIASTPNESQIERLNARGFTADEVKAVAREMLEAIS